MENLIFYLYYAVFHDENTVDKKWKVLKEFSTFSTLNLSDSTVDEMLKDTGKIRPYQTFIFPIFLIRSSTVAR